MIRNRLRRILQVTSIGGLKYGLPRGFTPIGRPTFQTRGNNRTQIAGRGKKTQMKVRKIFTPSWQLSKNLLIRATFQATGKKKTTVKKSKECEKKDSRGRGNNVDGITDYK